MTTGLIWCTIYIAKKAIFPSVCYGCCEFNEKNSNPKVKEIKVKELVETVCKSLVDVPEEVSVTQIDGEQTSILELRVHHSDIGKVIGKQGRTARAIRTILAAAGMKQKRRFNLEIIEDFKGAKGDTKEIEEGE